MSSVVLRCSNCGTSQAAAGECEACHEAQVRYFCTNHAPGLWLDAPACGRCGARFGEVAPAPRAAEPPIARSRAASPRPPLPTVEPEPGPWSARPPERRRVDDAEDYPEPDRDVAPNPWSDLVAGASRFERTPGPAAEEMDPMPMAVPVGGCLKRVLMLVLSLFALFVLASLLLGGFLLQLL